MAVHYRLFLCIAILIILTPIYSTSFGDFEPVDGELMIFFPGESWKVRVPQGDWKLMLERRPADTVYYYFFTSEKLRLNFSIFLDKTTKCHSGVECRELFWANRGPGYKNPKGVKKFQRNGFAIVQFYLDKTAEYDHKQTNVCAHMYWQGYWIDIHLSMVGSEVPNPEPMLQFLDNVVIK